MIKTAFPLAALACFIATSPGVAQVKNFIPVTQEMLLQPGARTTGSCTAAPTTPSATAPLKRSIAPTSANCAWRGRAASAPALPKPSPSFTTASFTWWCPAPSSRRSTAPTAIFSGSTSARRPPAQASSARTKDLAIYQDIVVYSAPDGYIVGLDARTGEQRWQTATGEGNEHFRPPHRRRQSRSPAKAAARRATPAYIGAYDALTGKEVWKFYNVPAPGEPGSESWGKNFKDTNLASTWGLPGTYDPVRKQLYWGIANAMPNTRLERHAAIPTALRAPRPPISTATPPCRSIPTPANSTGITSTCPATIGIRTTRTNAPWCARSSIPIRSS